MGKAKAIRLTGFVGALCVSAVLVGASVTGTGAWFTDSKAGSITGSSGHLTLNATSTNLSYANLMPGTNVDKAVDYSTDVSSGGVDLWLVFNHDGAGYIAFTGGKNSPGNADGGLGRFGYFAVSDSHGGLAFRSGNLSFQDYGISSNYPIAGDCSTDANGRGGSDWIATDGNITAPYKCGVPDKILLATNLPTATSGTVTVTFGLNGTMQTGQGQLNEPNVSFNLVATQTGHRP